jgi:hypothetical protein
MNTTVLRRLGTVARRATTVSNIGTVNWRRSIGAVEQRARSLLIAGA